MCIILVKESHVDIPEKYLEKMFQLNNDGYGLAYSYKNTLHYYNGIDNFKNFLKEYDLNKDKKMIIHFRFRTSGDIIKANAHPFIIHAGTLAIMHNGVLSDYENRFSSESDTANFIKSIEHYSKTTIDAILDVTSKTSYNKFAVMNNRGDIFLYGHFYDIGKGVKASRDYNIKGTLKENKYSKWDLYEDYNKYFCFD